MDWKQINLNDRVRVKLNEGGRKVLEDHYRSFDLEPPKLSPDGYFESQLWDLMILYGNHVYIGNPLPFESTTIEIRTEG